MSTNIDVPPMPGMNATAEEWAAYYRQIDGLVKAHPDHALIVGRLDGNPVQVRSPWPVNADKWIEGVQTVGAQRWVEGVQNPRAEFKQAALKNNEGWKASVQQAVQEDRFAKGMAKVDVEDAIATAVAVGPQGYSAGAAARKNKFKRNVEAIQGRMAAAVQNVRNMPAKTDADRENRMVAMVRAARAAAKGT